MRSSKSKTKKFFTKWRFFQILAVLVLALSFLHIGTNIFIPYNIAEQGNQNTFYISTALADEITNGTTGATEGEPAPGSSGSECGWICQGFRLAVAWLLYFVFQVVAMLLGIAGILFDWVVKTDNVDFVLKNSALYDGWKMVRDVLNLSFILVLLFSAFCTIFQVEKYHLKKILLMLVIMALLVNFSFPVSRFIIDVSNVMFYFIINSMFSGQSGSEITSSFAGFSGIVDILKPSQISSSTNLTYLIAAIVFTFILMITLLVIAVMFVIRLVALGILIIFSPVGFVAAIFPSTKHYADDWWTNLFKYSFFAPIMAFMMAIALKILAVMNTKVNGKNAITNFVEVAGNNVSNSKTDPNLFGNMAYFAIPIVILWIGLITAQKMSIAGADVVTNRAKQFAGWAGRTFTGIGAAGRMYRAYHARREEARQTGVMNRMGRWLGSRQDQLRSALLPGGRDAAIRYQRDLAARVKQESERHDTAHMAPHELRELAEHGNRFERAAAMQELANKSQATQADLANMQAAFGINSQVFRQLADKVREYNPTAGFAHITDDAERFGRLSQHLRSPQFDKNKLTAAAINEELVEAMNASNVLSNKDIVDIAKDPAKRSALARHYGALAATYADNTNEGHQRAHMANFALTGQVVNDAFARNIAENVDKDTAVNLDWTRLNPAQRTTFVDHIRKNKISEVLHGIKNDRSARDYAHALRTFGSADVQNYLNSHPNLRNF